MIQDLSVFEDITYRDDLSHYMINRKGEVYSKRVNRVLKPQIDNTGYYWYVLTSDNGTKIRYTAHIGVAKQFMPNFDKTKTIVNHIDENKQNPCVDNLEWVTPKENTNHGTAIQRSSNHRKKPVNEYDITGRYVRTWNSISDVADYFVDRLGVDAKWDSLYNSINQNCKGKCASAYGRIWKYYKGNTLNIIPDYGIKNEIGLLHSKSKLSLIYESPIPDEYLYHEKTKEDIYNYFINLDKLTDYEKKLFKQYARS